MTQKFGFILSSKTKTFSRTLNICQFSFLLFVCGNRSRLPWEDEGSSLRRGRQGKDQKQEERSPALSGVPMQHGVETKENTKFSESPNRGGIATQQETASNQIQSTPQKLSGTQTDSALPWERPRVHLSSTPHSQKSEFSDSGMDPSYHPIPQKSLKPPAEQPTQLTQPQVQLDQAISQPSIPRMQQQLTSAAISSSGQNQYPSPIPGLPQMSALERLEMQKLAAESRLQQSQLLEYSVAEEQYAREKARLEEEVKLLMSRVQEMDSARQNKDLDASSRISELEGKVSLLFTAIILTSQLTTGKKAKNVKQDSRIQKVYSNQYKYQTSNGTAESNSVQLSLST